MEDNDKEFLARLLATFKLEAAEHIKALSSGLIELEAAATPEKRAEITEVVFREAHSLKGAARSVNIAEIEKLCQTLESVFAGLKRGELTLSPAFLDVLHMAVDNLQGLLPAIERERTPEEKAAVAGTIRSLDGLLKGAPPPAPPASCPEPHPEPAAEEKPALTETVRISAARLESLVLQAEELLAAKLAADQLALELRDVNNYLSLWEAQWSRAHADVTNTRRGLEARGNERQARASSRTARLLDFLDWNAGYVKMLEERVARLSLMSEHNHYTLEGVADGLMQDTRETLMLPVASLLETLPRLVRDLAREQGKEIKLVTSGGEIEIDRRILEAMKDPLIHLVRNCVDHGLEKPDDRVSQGKSPQGTITVAMSQKSSSSVEMLVADDGIGINLDKVQAVAVKRGIIAAEVADKLDTPETLSLIYRSGFSTSPIITDISGRGLGLAIVQEKVEKVRGAISVESQPGSGTAFRIALPLTVATFRGVVVRQGEHTFVLPTTGVERTVRVKQEEIKTVENRETIRLDGRALSFARLQDVLELPATKREWGAAEYRPVLVLASGDKRIAFLVDEIVGEQEVLVKSLGSQLTRVRNVVGVSVLATGKIAPVLNTVDLIKSAVNVSPSSSRAATAEEPGEKQSILVVEDSITARMLLKNVLETAGYDVKTAVDGVDALATLKTAAFNLVVSDVDMPRMNGFELTIKIRANRGLTEIPVVLVTALESREHRERGVDVGANAYIVKSSFDQGNLLEVIRRLI